MERAAQHLQSLAVIVTQGPPAVHAGIGESLHLIRRGANDEEGQAGYVINMRVADIGNIIFMAGHLPDALPKAFNLALMFFARPIAVGCDLGHACRHW